MATTPVKPIISKIQTDDGRTITLVQAPKRIYRPVSNKTIKYAPPRPTLVRSHLKSIQNDDVQLQSNITFAQFQKNLEKKYGKLEEFSLKKTKVEEIDSLIAGV